MSTKTADWTGHTLEGRNGRYRIKSALGSGGMATVYLASDSRGGKDVAVKLPHEMILREEGFAARFTREIKSLIKLAHPNIVKVIDVGEFNRAPFAVLQYLALGSLRLQQPLDLENGKVWPMSPDEVPGWLTPISDALDFVHSKHFVHRDVKPENIMFDAEGNAYLGDFGVIKARAESREGKPETVATGAGLVLGTPHYMAPEVLMGEQYDGRADQYSLAVTVYELLAARVPFPGDAPVAIVGHTTRPVPKLTTLVPGIPPEVEQVVLKGLAKRKEDRYDDCRSFAQAFAQAVRATAKVPVAAGKAKPPPPPPSNRAVTPPPMPVGQRLPPPAVPKRTAPVLCPYCGTQANLPPGVRSKAVRCAGCRKVYLLDAPNSGAGTAKQEQATTDTKPDERRVPPPPPPPPEPRRTTPAKVRTRRPEPEPEPPPPRKPPRPAKPPKPKGPPFYTQPWFRKLLQRSIKATLILILFGAGAYGIYWGVGEYQKRESVKIARLSDKACDEGRYADAIRHADAALAKDPDSAQALVSRARARYFQSDHESALDDLNKALLMDPDNALGLAYRSAVQSARGLTEEAMVDGERAVKLNSELAVAHAYKGLAKLEAGDRAEAEASCNTAVAKGPDNPEAYRVRAIVLKGVGKGSQATDDMNTAVSKSADQAFYMASRGMFQFLPAAGSTSRIKMDELILFGSAPSSAQIDGKKAVDKDATCGLGHLALAAFHARNRNWDEAITAAERAIAASPRLAAAYELEYSILFDSLKRQTDGMAVLNRGLKEIPTSPRLRSVRGSAHMLRSEYDDAVADFTELVQLNPRDPRGFELRANAYRFRGKVGDSNAATEDDKKAESMRKK